MTNTIKVTKTISNGSFSLYSFYRKGSMIPCHTELLQGKVTLSDLQACFERTGLKGFINQLKINKPIPVGLLFVK